MEQIGAAVVYKKKNGRWTAVERGRERGRERPAKRSFLECSDRKTEKDGSLLAVVDPHRENRRGSLYCVTRRRMK